MTDDELDRQLRDSMSGLDLPGAPSTLRVAVSSLDRAPVDLPRPRARLGPIAVPILGIALLAIAVSWWAPRSGLAPGASASPTSAPAATQASSPAPVPSAAPSPLAYADDCAAFELSIRRCRYIVDWAKLEAGFTAADPVDVQLLGDDSCPDGCIRLGGSFVVRVRLVSPDGISHDESVFCGIHGQYSLLCTDTPEIAISTPMGAYSDVPCSGEAPDNPCATPVPTPDPSAMAAAESLVVDSLHIPIDHVGRYVIEVGEAVLPNGILTEATFSLRDAKPTDVLVTPDGVRLEVRTLDGELLENIYAHGWRSGTERVEATLTFTIESFEPGAVLEVRDVTVR